MSRWALGTVDRDPLEGGEVTWVWWFNEIRLHSKIGYVSPLEFEAACSRHNNPNLTPSRLPSIHQRARGASPQRRWPVAVAVAVMRTGWVPGTMRPKVRSTTAASSTVTVPATGSTVTSMPVGSRPLIC